MELGCIRVHPRGGDRSEGGAQAPRHTAQCPGLGPVKNGVKKRREKRVTNDEQLSENMSEKLSDKRCENEPKTKRDKRFEK